LRPQPPRPISESDHSNLIILICGSYQEFRGLDPSTPGIRVRHASGAVQCQDEHPLLLVASSGVRVLNQRELENDADKQRNGASESHI
jgi:hypothetical protein